jgi:hypothetical protein
MRMAGAYAAGRGRTVEGVNAKTRSRIVTGALVLLLAVVAVAALLG